MPQVKSTPPTWRLLAAFAAVYLIWGSTYLGIRIAVGTIPPFLLAGTRFLIAGVILYVLARRRGAKAPTRINWRAAFIVGGLLLLGGNSLVVWSEQRIPSGLAAVLVAAVPLWMVTLDWLFPRPIGTGTRPSRPVIVGLLLGLAGIVLLIGPDQLLRGAIGSVDLIGALVLMVATFCWANGSLYSRRAALPADGMMATGMENLAGGVLAMLVGAVTGEWNGFNLAQVSPQSWLALAYLAVFGSIIAFSAYVWLLREQPTARVSTYAFVNPVVAVFLGALAGEALTSRTLVAAGVIIVGVILITIYRSRPAVKTPDGLPVEAPRRSWLRLPSIRWREI